MKRGIFKIFLLGSTLILLWGCGRDEDNQSQDVQWEKSSEVIEKGPLKVQVQMAKESFSILDRQHLRIDVSASPNIQLSFPGYEERFEDLRVVPWRPDQESREGDRKTITKYVAFEIFESGEQALPPIRIHYDDPMRNQSGYIDTPSLTFTVAPIDDPSLVNAPLSPSLDLQRPTPWPWWPWLLGLVVIALVAFGLRRFVANRSSSPSDNTPPPVPPYQWAYEQLKQLTEEQASGELDNEGLVDRLTAILRGYVERRYRLKAPELTTDEFVAELPKVTALAEHHRVLQRFLEFADLVKFAGQKAKPEDTQKGFDFLREFVENTREDLP